MNITTENAIKTQIGFGQPMSCGNCTHCHTEEKDLNSPVRYECMVAGILRFTVEEDTWCHKWEEN